MSLKKFFRLCGRKVLILFVFISVFPCLACDLAFAQEEIPVIETETGFYYVIQEGDTLWDLSRRFSDSPWQWPDLWSKNKQIANPHWIYPGQKIRLYRRTDVEMAETAAADEKTMEDAFDDSMIFVEKEPEHFIYSPIESTGFIRQDLIPPDGSILKVADEKEMISTGDVVFVKHLEKAMFSPGEQYVTYRTISPVIHPKTGGKLGIQYLLTGVVEIVRSEIKFSVAKVIKSYRTIRVGNFLMPYKPRSPRIPIVESRFGLYGSIVASEKLTSYYGDDTVVFIDKGELDGARPGQFYHVYRQDTVLYDEKTRERVQLTPILLGSLFVLHTEENTSTVLINKVNYGVPLGSVFGAPVP